MKYLLQRGLILCLFGKPQINKMYAPVDNMSVNYCLVIIKTI